MATTDLPRSHRRSEHPELDECLTKIAGLLLSEEKLDSILELVVSLTKRTLPHADGVSVTLVRDGHFKTAVYANEVTRRVDSWQYATDEGPCLSAALEGVTYVAQDLNDEPRWPEFATMALQEGVQSVLSVPFVPLGQPIGSLNTYSRCPDAFDDAHVELASLFAQQAAIVIANSVAYSTATLQNGQLKQALDSREIIGQAKGVLMEREKCSADEAFETLKRVSQTRNRKLRDVAQDVVNTAQRA